MLTARLTSPSLSPSPVLVVVLPATNPTPERTFRSPVGPGAVTFPLRMRDLDEGSASEEENFQRCRQKRARRGTATANGKDKATTAAAAAATVAEEEGPA